MFSEGRVGIFGFTDLADVWFGFSVFRFLDLPRFAGFLEFSLWFSVFVNNDGGFSDSFCPVHLTVCVVLPRKLQPAVGLKPVSNSKGPYIAFYPFF